MHVVVVTIVDNDDARARFVDTRLESISHRMGAGKLGEIRRVGIEQHGREARHKGRRQQFHESREDYEVGLEVRNPIGQSLSPGIAWLANIERLDEGGNPVAVSVSKTGCVHVRADRDNFGGDRTRRATVEEVAQV